MTFSVAQAKKSAQRVREVRWRQYREVRRLLEQAMPVRQVQRETTGESVVRIRMIVSDWFRDENGIPTRTVRAA